MQKAKLRAVGGSVMVAIPPAMLDLLRIGANSSVAISVEGQRLIVEPQPRTGRIGLAARLALCDFSAPPSAEEREWPGASRVGREEI
jgi:antitoxin ChpS